jgi:hypothetical protein
MRAILAGNIGGRWTATEHLTNGLKESNELTPSIQTAPVSFLHTKGIFDGGKRWAKVPKICREDADWLILSRNHQEFDLWRVLWGHSTVELLIMH